MLTKTIILLCLFGFGLSSIMPALYMMGPTKIRTNRVSTEGFVSTSSDKAINSGNWWHYIISPLEHFTKNDRTLLGIMDTLLTEKQVIFYSCISISHKKNGAEKLYRFMYVTDRGLMILMIQFL